MAGTLVLDTLRASSGVLATQNGMTGIAKAWVYFNGSTATINGSFNVGSITKNGTGDYTVNYTTAMPNANYAITGATGEALNGYGFGVYATGGTVPTTSLCRVVSYRPSVGYGDTAYMYVAIFGA